MLAIVKQNSAVILLLSFAPLYLFYILDRYFCFFVHMLPLGHEQPFRTLLGMFHRITEYAELEGTHKDY